MHMVHDINSVLYEKKVYRLNNSSSLKASEFCSLDLNNQKTVT